MPLTWTQPEPHNYVTAFCRRNSFALVHTQKRKTRARYAIELPNNVRYVAVRWINVRFAFAFISGGLWWPVADLSSVFELHVHGRWHHIICKTMWWFERTRSVYQSVQLFGLDRKYCVAKSIGTIHRKSSDAHSISAGNCWIIVILTEQWIKYSTKMLCFVSFETSLKFNGIVMWLGKKDTVNDTYVDEIFMMSSLLHTLLYLAMVKSLPNVPLEPTLPDVLALAAAFCTGSKVPAIWSDDMIWLALIKSVPSKLPWNWLHEFFWFGFL